MSKSKEPLAHFLENSPESWDCILIARARFVMSAALRNFARNLLTEVEKMAEEGTIPDFLAYDVLVKLADIFRIDDKMDREKVEQEALEDCRKMWSAMSHMLRAYIAEQESQALTYRELTGGDTTDIDNVNFYWGQGIV